MLVVLVVLTWLAASVVVALVLGRVLRRRNEQIPLATPGPTEVPEVPVGAVPGPRRAGDGPVTGGGGRPVRVP